jgi:aquaporin Z
MQGTIPQASKSWQRWLAYSAIVFFYEAMGTFMLVCAVNSSNGDPTAVGLVLFVLLLIATPVSGGHFNPSVSIGVFINKDATLQNFIQLINMIAAQFCGAIVGNTFIYSILENNKDTP